MMNNYKNYRTKYRKNVNKALKQGKHVKASDLLGSLGISVYHF